MNCRTFVLFFAVLLLELPAFAQPAPNLKAFTGARLIDGSGDILVAATGMGLEEVGTLAAGNWVDFIVLTGAPLVDVANTKTLESVYIAGNTVARE
jgi:hypothetical protein